MLPNWLQPGQTLMGKYFIQNVVSYKEIFEQELLSKISVFAEMKPVMPNQGTQSGSIKKNRSKQFQSFQSSSGGMIERRSSNFSKITIEAKSNQHMNYLTLLNTNYAYRLRTLALFEQGQPTVCFDIFIVENDMRFKEYNLFENLWRETLLLHHLKNQNGKVLPVVNFG